MNQLETNLVVWAICAIILLELLFIICLCRCFFNRIKPKRFYVKKEEYEYLQGNTGTSPQFQSTILRPPHADELALVGTVREPNPPLRFDHGVQNFGFYRDDDDDKEFLPTASSVLATPPSSSQHLNWIELRSPPPPTDAYMYSHQSLVPRPTIIDFGQYRDDYDSNDHFNDDNDDELEKFQFHSLHHSDVMLAHIHRTDTSTESFGGNHLILAPKSILKGSSSTTPPLDLPSMQHSHTHRSRTSSKFDESSRISVKINTDQSIPIDYPTSAIEKTTPNDSIALTSNRMRFASVSQLNEVEWEVPREFQNVVYDLIEDRQRPHGALVYSSNENLNNNNNNKLDYHEKLSNRQRSQSAIVDQRTYVSHVFVPWRNREKQIDQSIYLSNDNEQTDMTQQKAFEY